MRLLVVGITVAVFAVTASAGGQPASPKPAGNAAREGGVPKTADGQPDLQGNWTNETITPFERPAGVGPVLPKEEVARLEKNVAERRDRLNLPSDPNRAAPPAGGDGSTGAAGMVGGYNNFWLDPGETVAIINGEY